MHNEIIILWWTSIKNLKFCCSMCTIECTLAHVIYSYRFFMNFRLFGLLCMLNFFFNTGIKLRRSEKKLLNDINNDTSGRLRFHVLTPNGKIKKRIQTVEEKMFVLINDALSGEPSTLDFTLNQVRMLSIQMLQLWQHLNFDIVINTRT